jgi:hypothetical protein
VISSADNAEGIPTASIAAKNNTPKDVVGFLVLTLVVEVETSLISLNPFGAFVIFRAF